MNASSADDQLALKHAVLQRADETQDERTFPAGIDRERIANRDMQHVLHRRRIRHDWHGAIVKLTAQQQPRVGSLAV